MNDEVKFPESKLSSMEQAAASNKMRTTWELINEISGKKTSNAIPTIKKKDESKYSNKDDLLSDWKDYFSNLLNVPSQTANIDISPASKDLPINTESITTDEVNKAIEQLKLGKAPGCDYSITPEAIKYGGDWMVQRMQEICNDIYDLNTAPKQLTTSIITPLPKKGDLTQMTNYIFFFACTYRKIDT